MSATDAWFTVLGVLAVVVAAAFALAPLWRRVAAPALGHPALSATLDERYGLYAQILEMEFDVRTGKLSDQDFRALTAPLLARANVLLLESQASEADLDDAIEREIAAARRILNPEALPVAESGVASR